MKTSSHHFLLLVSSAICCASLNCHSADAKDSSKKPVNALQLTQKHFYLGNVALTISRDGIRLDGDPKQKFIVVSKPPEWKVTVYRLDDKTYFEQDMKTSLSAGLVSGIFMKYRPSFILKTVPPRPIKFQGFDSFHQSNDDDCFEYMPLEKNMPPEIEPLIHAFYKLPTGGGIPLTYVTSPRGKDILMLKPLPNSHREFLVTSKVTRKNVDTHIFDVPSGLRRAKYVGEVMVNESARKQGADLNSLMDAPSN